MNKAQHRPLHAICLVLLLLSLALPSCGEDDSSRILGDASSMGPTDSGLKDAAAPDASAVDATKDVAVLLDASADSNLDAMASTRMVFSKSLDDTLPPEIAPGDCALTPSEGYAPLGPDGNKFGPTFLRCTTSNTFTLSLTELPAHTSLDIGFLFAAIDSLDGTGAFPAGDFFSVYVDDRLVFQESFANATPSQIQSYNPPPGVELARRVDLGFSGPGGFYTDSAYNFGADPVFAGIPHVGPTAVLKFTLTGGGVQGLSDESWAIDNLRVAAGNTPRAQATDAGPPDGS